MDVFGLCLNAFCLLGQGVLHIAFVRRLTGKERTLRGAAVYLLLLVLTEYCAAAYAVPALLSVGVQMLLLYAVSRLMMGNPRLVSWCAAIFAVYILQLSSGVVNSVEAVVFPYMVGKAVLYPLIVLAVLCAFAICAACYAAVLRLLSLREDVPLIVLLLLPTLFFFAAQMYILDTAYSTVSYRPQPEQVGVHMMLLILQVLGLAALLCTLYAYRSLCRNLRAQSELRSLTQAVRAQKIFISEAQSRSRQTRAFRHDIRNHLCVLDGLLSRGKTEEGKAYLRKLKTASARLSFPCQSGNTVVDILLAEKLERARESGIAAEATLRLPTDSGIDDFDFCVLFANALDNAICACRAVEGEKSICIKGERQGDFYLLTFENTCAEGPLPPAGIGLSNIKSAAEKYRGAMMTEKKGGRFTLNVLLNISLHAGDISEQTG